MYGPACSEPTTRFRFRSAALYPLDSGEKDGPQCRSAGHPPEVPSQGFQDGTYLSSMEHDILDACLESSEDPGEIGMLLALLCRQKCGRVLRTG